MKYSKNCRKAVEDEFFLKKILFLHEIVNLLCQGLFVDGGKIDF